MALALRNLPLPVDCINVIQSYAFVDPSRYKNKLIFKSVLCLLKRATSVYNWNESYDDTWLFRWYYTHLQHQAFFCKCGEFTDTTIGELQDCCKCKCI